MRVHNIASRVACNAVTYTVVLAGANPLALDRLQQLAAGAGEVSCCKTISSLAAIRAHFRNPLIVVIDAGSLGPAAVCWFDAVMRAMPSARILAVGGPADTCPLSHLFALGAHGFVAYEDTENNLAGSLRRLVAGDLVFPLQVIERAAVAARAGCRPLRTGRRLTRREVQILELVRGSLSNKEIGSALGLTERTVRFHLGNAFQKLAVDNRMAAANAFARLVAWSPIQPAPHPSFPLSHTTGVSLSFRTAASAHRNR